MAPVTKQYRLNDQETEQWRAKGDQGAEAREFMAETVMAGEKPGTQIELFDAWGQLLTTIVVPEKR